MLAEDERIMQTAATQILTAAGEQPTAERVQEVVQDLQDVVGMALVDALSDEGAAELAEWTDDEMADEAELTALLARDGVDVEAVAKQAILQYQAELLEGGKDAE